MAVDVNRHHLGVADIAGAAYFPAGQLTSWGRGIGR